MTYERSTVPVLPRLKVSIRIVSGTQFTEFNIFFMKWFKTNDIVVVIIFSYFSSPSDIWARRKKKLDATYMTCDKIFLHYGHYIHLYSPEVAT